MSIQSSQAILGTQAAFDPSRSSVMSLPSAAPQSSLANHPRVVAFFREQAEIGQRPGSPLPMQFPRSVYAQVDEGCYASINSPDWRSRKISVVATEMGIDLLLRELRKPIIDATERFYSDHESEDELPEGIQDAYLMQEYPAALVPEGDRNKFITNEESGALLFAMSYADLSALVLKFQNMEGKTAAEMPGCCTGRELIRRMNSIMSRFFQPECRFLEEFFQSGKAPIVTIHGKKSFVANLAAMHVHSGEELAKRMKASGFPLDYTASMVKTYCEANPGDNPILSRISKKGSVMLEPIIGW